MAKKHILITGGAGFIGSNLVRNLLEKNEYHIMVLDALTYAGSLDNFSIEMRNNPDFEFWYGNIRNSALVLQLVRKADIIVHLAAETHVARSIYDNTVFFETDVLGTHALVNSTIFSDIERFIHISTSEVYGTAVTDIMDETHPLNTTTPYASAKAGADRLVYSYFLTYDLPGVILRPFNNYGPFQHLEKVIPHFISSAIINEPLTIHGDGKNSRDWLFVDDHCDVIEKCISCDIEKINHEIINIGTGKDSTIIKIADMILEYLNKPKDLIKFIGDRPGQVRRHLSSTEKALKLFNWKAQTSFEQGLIKTIEWYKRNQKWWQNMLWMKRCNTEEVWLKR